MRSRSALLTRKPLTLPEVDSVFTLVGSGGVDGDLRSGTVTVLLRHDRAHHAAVQCRPGPVLLGIPDLRIGFGRSGSGNSNTLQTVLVSDNADLLATTALTLESQMREVPAEQRPPGNTPPRHRTGYFTQARRGGTPGRQCGDPGAITRVATLGDVDANTAKFNSGEQRLPIRVRLADEARTDLSSLRNLRVPTARGSSVPLAAVATSTSRPGWRESRRYDRQRRVMVEAQFDGISL